MDQARCDPSAAPQDDRCRVVKDTKTGVILDEVKDRIVHETGVILNEVKDRIVTGRRRTL